MTWLWRPPQGVPDYRARLARVILPWVGTPYRSGACLPRVGVDCVRFTCAVLDSMSHKEWTQFDTMPTDVSLHSREGAIEAILAIRRHFRPNETVMDDSLEPGDVVLVGTGGHAMLVGCRPGEFWHASSLAKCVVRSGQSYFQTYPIHSVIRYGRREEWCHD